MQRERSIIVQTAAPLSDDQYGKMTVVEAIVMYSNEHHPGHVSKSSPYFVCIIIMVTTILQELQEVSLFRT
jgi:hypothetical protein